MAADEREGTLRRAAERFNEGDLDAVLALLHPMAEWPDLMADKLIWGHAAIRDYWERQLLVVAPHLTPTQFVTAGEDLVMLSTQRVQDRATGEEMIPTMEIAQRYSFKDGLISRMRFFRTLDEALAAEE